MKLLAILLAMAVSGQAVTYTPAPNSLYTLDNTLVEDAGNYTALVNTGAVPFDGTRIGPFASGKYLSPSAALISDFSGYTNWTIYFQSLSVPALIANNVLWSAGTLTYLRINATGTVTWSNGVGTFDSAISITANTNFQLAVRYNGTDTRIYYAAAGAPTWVDIGTNAVLSGDITVTGLILGNYSAATTFPFNGLIGGWMQFNSALDAPPVADVVATPTNTQLSPYMMPRQARGNFVSPTWWRP